VPDQPPELPVPEVEVISPAVQEALSPPTLQRRRFWDIFLEFWMPAILTASLGGLAVVLVVPRIQSEYARDTKYWEQKLELWESVGEHFSIFMENRRRLNVIAVAISNAKTENEEIEQIFINRKDEYRSKRDSASDRLGVSLLMATYYFESEELRRTVEEFIKWNSRFKDVTVDKLPGDDDYGTWRDRILRLMGRELEL